MGRVGPAEQRAATQKKIVAFVQEGIGALLAYLPTDVALKTLKDFIGILEPDVPAIPNPIEAQIYQAKPEPKPPVIQQP